MSSRPISAHYMGRGDTIPHISADLRDPDGDPLDLDSATVSFRMWDPATDIVITGAATIDNASTGSVRYAWAAGDTLYPGTYRGEFIVTKNGQRTVPNAGWIPVIVKE
jgi:hypothetical protein